MNTRSLSIGLLSLAIIGGAGAWAFAQAGQPPAKPQTPAAVEKESDEEIITLDKAPAAVQAAAIKLAGDAKNITKVIKEEDEEDVVTFEIEYTQGAGADAIKCAAILSPAGDLMETEKATTEARLPAAAMAALRKEYPKATFADPQSVTKMYYEISVVIDGKGHEVKVDAAGGIEDDSEHGKEHADKDGEEKKHEDKAKPAGAERGAAPGADGWRAEFAVNKAALLPTGAGRYFVLQPGRTMTFAGGDTVVVMSMLDQTKVVDGVTTRIVEERESKGGALVEVSRNYFAIEPASGDVYYFGEDVDIYKDGKVSSHEGAWLSGVKGAKFGLFIPGSPILGDKYYQELAPGEAMDRFEIVSLGEHLDTTAGVFDRVVKTEETTPLESGKGFKWFAPGVGMVRDGELTLTRIETAPTKK